MIVQINFAGDLGAAELSFRRRPPFQQSSRLWSRSLATPAGPRGLSAEMAEAAASFRPNLRARAFELTGNAANADDLVGQTYLLLCERPPEWRGPAQLKNWLRTVMRNTRNEELRAAYRLQAQASGKRITREPEFTWNGSEWIANPAKATPAA